MVQGGGQRVNRPKEAQSLDREYKGCVSLTTGSFTSVADAAGKQEDVKTSWASFLLLLISNLLSLWSENIFCMILILLNLLSFLWPDTWHILENIPCAFEKSLYSSVVGWCVLHMSVRSSWLIVLFKSSMSLMTSYLVVLSISGMFSNITEGFFNSQWTLTRSPTNSTQF